MSTDLAYASIREISRLLARREVSPLELVRSSLERIRQIDAKINAFLTRTEETALADARRAEEEIRAGRYRGPLYGIPVAYKDLFDTQGVETTSGSPFFAGRVPSEDAFVVERLKEAGTVMLGKLNMHEIALGVTNVNPHYGACRNPWNLERMSGGSSGGSAAALAAGMTYAALGSDTGGSIRIPAALCGVVGLKPTFGRVSLRGVMPLSWHLDHPGPMARSVWDAALLLDVIAGYDPADPVSADMPAPDSLSGLEEDIQGWRVALAVDEFFSRAEAPVWEGVRAAAGQFERLGAKVDEVAVPNGRRAAQANGVMVTSEAAAVHRHRLEKEPERFGEDVRQRLESGAAYTSGDYIAARRTQTLLRRQFEIFFETYDLLLTPTTPIPAPCIEGQDAVKQAAILTSFTAPFNLTGLPAISVPCGFTPDGLPVGLQIVAAPWQEAKLLRAAYRYEQSTEWRLHHPPDPAG